MAKCDLDCDNAQRSDVVVQIHSKKGSEESRFCSDHVSSTLAGAKANKLPLNIFFLKDVTVIHVGIEASVKLPKLPYKALCKFPV